MKHLSSIRSLKRLSVIVAMSVIAVPSLMAQTSNPRGLYRLTEIVHQDGKHLETDYRQYRYCQDNSTIVLTYRPIDNIEKSFNVQITSPDGKPLTLTGELSKTENKGTQIIGTSDSTFTYRWYNDQNNSDERLFPYQTNIDEEYMLVKDSTDAIQRVLNLLQMKFGTKQHRIQGIWKQRGIQQTNDANSQYWIQRGRVDTYLILGECEAVVVISMPGSPAPHLQCFYTPCSILSDHAFEYDGKASIVHWFDGETISVTAINNDGRPYVTVWDRCGMPQNIQDVFGTNTPQMKKDISRFFVDEFVKKYGNQSDAVRQAYETFDFAIDANEQNNAIFPILMRSGFEDEYKALKDSLMARLMRGEINIDDAVGQYVFWFYKNFDRHTNCSSQRFYKLRSEAFVNYEKLIPQYAPEPVGCKVDDETYLLRLPSSMGDKPTWEWTQKKAEEFKQSGCQYLILDLRGNHGGSDAFGEIFAKMMCDCSAMNDEQSFYRSSTLNNERLKKICSVYSYMNHILTEALSTEEGALINWHTTLKGTDKYTPLVRKGAIIIDNYSASAGESPVRFVRNYSKKHATVYGRERTNGCELSGNCNTIRLPHSNLSLTYPMTVDAAFEEACKEREPGHKPDVIIPLPYPEQLTDNIDPWVLWVAKKMKK
jgi:hypothetical protein